MSVQNKLNKKKYSGNTECKHEECDYSSSSSSCSSDDECCGPPGPRGPRGKQGPRGCRGHRGHRGYTGYTGYTGFTGYTGYTGYTGFTGDIGPTGPKGDTGDKGDKGDTGDKGDKGETGDIGPTGPIGPTGWQGELGPTGPHYMCETYLNIYNLAHYMVLPEADLTYDSHRTISGNIGHILNTSEIYIWETGVYFVHYHLFHLEPAQFALFLNDNYYEDSVVTNQSSASILSHSFLLTINEEDLIPTSSPFGTAAKVTIKNHTSYPPLGVSVDGHTGTGYTVNNPNTELLIFLIGKAKV